ncbi:hypothetical protein Gasu2_52000 [Galdieria sulphuraria]|nr:hypothetical protein Gasu2_52000 [Galdieria sulphuraria]
MSNFTSSTADKKDQKEEQSWKALLRNGSWKDLYDKAEECFISGNHLDADNACFFACLMLASLLKLGKLELARKWLNSWKEQYGLEDVPTATLFLFRNRRKLSTATVLSPTKVDRGKYPNRGLKV